MEMIRCYSTNLLFRNDPNPIIDEENIDAQWDMYIRNNKVDSWGGGLDFSNPSFLGILDNIHTLMTITSPNTYLKCNNQISTSTNRFSILIRFYIPENDIYRSITDRLPIPILKWDEGMINIMDFLSDDNTWVNVTIGDHEYRGPIRYNKLDIDAPHHIIMVVDHTKLVVSIDGIRIIDTTILDFNLTTLTNLKVGNCGDSNIELQIDSLAITDSAETPISFTVKPYHSLYPEADEVDIVKHRRVNTVSIQDRISLDLDIARHSDYTPPASYKVDRVRRYQFDNKREG